MCVCVCVYVCVTGNDVMFYYIMYVRKYTVYTTDVITGIKSGSTSSVTAVDVEASLSLNDLSQLSLKASTGKSELDIFSRLPPEKFGPKGNRMYI